MTPTATATITSSPSPVARQSEPRAGSGWLPPLIMGGVFGMGALLGGGLAVARVHRNREPSALGRSLEA